MGYALGRESVDVVCFDAVEALGCIGVVVAVVLAAETGAETGVHGGGVENEAFRGGNPEHGAVREVGLGARVGGPGGGIGAGMPGVEVRVEVEDGDGLGVGLAESAEGGKSDAVVAAEGDEFGVDVRWGVGEGQRAPGEELCVRGGHLVEGQRVVEGGDGDVAAVEDEGPRCVWVYAGAVVEAAVGGLAGGGVAD